MLRTARFFAAMMGLLPGIAMASISNSDSIAKVLRHEIQARKTVSFQKLLESWSARFGSSATLPLIQIARDTREADPNRYVALMGAAKLGGHGAASLFVPLLKDHSWMMRSGALRVLSAIGDASVSSSVLPLLQDSALVVRLEAVDAAEKLHPPGVEDALIRATQNRANYVAGKAIWVPERALLSLSKLQARAVAPRLLPLLDHQKDPKLVSATIHALEVIEGRRLAIGKSLAVQAESWKQALKKHSS